MPNVCLILSGPPQAAYPNGGDEAYWMGQVAGALAAHLARRGIELCWGKPSQPDPEALWLVLGSQAAPAEEEGSKKGPVVLAGGQSQISAQAAQAVGEQLSRVYPQPELLVVEEAPNTLPEEFPGEGVLVRLLYRDNPQDEAWLARNTGPVGEALAQGIAQVVKGHA